MTNAYACVIGATGGIGRVVAERLWTAGYHLCVTGRNAEQLHLLSIAFPALRPTTVSQQMVPLLLDVTDEAAVATLATQYAERCGPLQLLVFCHGAAAHIGPTSQLTLEDYTQVYAVDVTGTIRIVHALYPFLEAGVPSSVVILGSYHAFGTYPERAPYAAAKTALLGLTRAWAIEWAARRIRCNYLAPGQVEGRRTRQIVGKAQRTTMLQRSPSGRIVQSEDIAETVVWMARCESLNGQAIVLDHGWSASYWWGDYS